MRKQDEYRLRGYIYAISWVAKIKNTEIQKRRLEKIGKIQTRLNIKESSEQAHRGHKRQRDKKGI